MKVTALRPHAPAPSKRKSATYGQETQLAGIWVDQGRSMYYAAPDTN